MGKYSDYKGVTKMTDNTSSRGKTRHKNKGDWCAVHLRWKSNYLKTEREAALAYDKKMIELGKPPVNILKPAT